MVLPSLATWFGRNQTQYSVRGEPEGWNPDEVRGRIPRVLYDKIPFNASSVVPVIPGRERREVGSLSNMVPQEPNVAKRTRGARGGTLDEVRGRIPRVLYDKILFDASSVVPVTSHGPGAALEWCCPTWAISAGTKRSKRWGARGGTPR